MKVLFYENDLIIIERENELVFTATLNELITKYDRYILEKGEM